MSGMMSGFFSALFAEMGARRRRLREAFGDRGQALVEFLVLGGLLVGSVGLHVRPWMPAAAPWGFGLPVLFLLGYVVIEARRQRALGAGGDSDGIESTHDWVTFLWALACALGGAAAFVLAWSAEPAPAAHEGWRPPAGAIESTIEPVSP